MGGFHHFSLLFKGKTHSRKLANLKKPGFENSYMDFVFWKKKIQFLPVGSRGSFFLCQEKSRVSDWKK